jgi:hypothetical protein
MLQRFVSANHIFSSIGHTNGGAKVGTGCSQSFDNDGYHDHNDYDDHLHHH